MFGLDWSRGFFRLWLLFAVPWVVGFLLGAAYELRNAQSTLEAWRWGHHGNLPTPDPYGDATFLVVVAVGVPVVLLIAGTGVLWALKGFGRTTSQPGAS